MELIHEKTRGKTSRDTFPLSSLSNMSQYISYETFTHTFIVCKNKNECSIKNSKRVMSCQFWHGAHILERNIQSLWEKDKHSFFFYYFFPFIYFYLFVYYILMTPLWKFIEDPKPGQESDTKGRRWTWWKIDGASTLDKVNKGILQSQYNSHHYRLYPCTLIHTVAVVGKSIMQIDNRWIDAHRITIWI